MTRPRRRTTLAREVAAAIADEPALEEVDPTYLDPHPHDDEPEMRWRFDERVGTRSGHLALRAALRRPDGRSSPHVSPAAMVAAGSLTTRSLP